MISAPFPSVAKTVFMEVLWTFINLPYRWGGDDPKTGFDCSGMTVEALKSIGGLPLKDDMNADSLWHKWNANFETKTPRRGALVFWFNAEGRAYHVAICIDDTHCLTADGGGSQTTSEQAAVDQNAFIKVRRIDHRASQPRYLYLWADRV
jgi:cell wall-associated NlpC family hydrolase